MLVRPGLSPKLFCTFILAALLCMPAASLSADGPAASHRVLARVQGENIWDWQLALTQILFFKNWQNLSGTEVSLSTEQVLQDAIDAELVRQLAEAKGFTVEDDLVEDLMWRYKSLFPSLRDYRNALKTLGITETELRLYARQSLTAGAYLEAEHQDGLEVSTGDIKDFYKEHIARFTTPKMARVRHILVRPSTPGKQGGREAKKRIQALRKRIIQGEPFSVTAREASDGPESSRGGDLGYVSRRSLEPTSLAPLLDVIFSLEPGQISNPIPMDDGWHLVLVEDFRPEEVRPFDDVKDGLLGVVQQQRTVELVHEIAGDLRKNAVVKILTGP